MTAELADTSVVTVVALILGMLPLEVNPTRGNGFAASIVGALIALAVLVVVMVFISSKPKNRGRRGS